MDGDLLSLVAQGGPWSVSAAAIGIGWRFFTLYQQSTEKRIEEAGDYKVLAGETKNAIITLTEVVKALAAQQQGNGK